jgi:hypothetical protein
MFVCPPVSCAAALLMLVTAPALAQQTPDWLQPGQEYYGHGAQNNGSGWSILLTVTGPDEVLVAYPTIPCGGVLRRLSQTGQILAFVETITVHVETCVSGGFVELEPLVPGALRYRWSNGPGLAEGTLVLLPLAKSS